MTIITPPWNHPSPHVIPSYGESISYESSLPIVAESQPLPLSPKYYPTIELSDEKLRKNSSEPLSTLTLNIVHHEVSNLPYIPSSSTPYHCDNRTYFELINLHRIFKCRVLRNQKHLAAATNVILVNYGILFLQLNPLRLSLIIQRGIYLRTV